ncbi:MAG: tetratricopeptide repeat protein [Alphaproteobacteria bacterium]|nr:tetratricopeptide repeat protein [Alphaproteobacteria bacterium]
MKKHDKRGNPVSYGSQAAIEKLDHAADMLAAYQADTLGAIDAVIAEHPDFALAHAMRAGALATATDKAFEDEALSSLKSAEALASGANEREQLLIAGCGAWLRGDLENGVESWGRASMLYPRDLTALQFAHAGDFFLGYSHMLRDRVARVLPQWSRNVPGYGFIQGMYAFGLEESGDYAAADEHGREAVSINAQDGWAAHAVAHVFEMQGRAKDGADFLAATSAGWEPGSGFAYHLWWHKALFHLDMHDAKSALRLFDEKVSAGGFGQALELIDGSALLWRLHLLGHDVGKRWDDISAKWESRVDHGYYVFNDVNAMMAFAATGNVAAQNRLIAAVKRAASGQGTNAMMSREVGLPACEGFAAFGRGEYAKAIDLLLPVRGKANRYGGSHAQRDMFSWTLTEAAIRLGDRALADAFVAERLAGKPESPVNRAWATRAAKLNRKQAA